MRLPPLLQLLRPKQWIKNAFVFAPVIFAQYFADLQAWGLSALAAASFLAMSGAVYIANDLHDVAEDRLHPVKRLRPLASGSVTPPQAMALAAALLLVAAALMTALPRDAALVIGFYGAANLAYTFYLKRVAVLDILTLASFYVLRVLAGCYAIEVLVSPWIIITTFVLALFLGFGKRYHEIGIEEYAAAKPNLQGYSAKLLEAYVVICAACALLTYAIYAAEMAIARGSLDLLVTVLFVTFGLLRYVQHLFVYRDGGDPAVIFFKDKAMMVNAALWLAACVWALR